MRFSASRFFSIAEFQSISAPTYGTGLYARAADGGTKIEIPRREGRKHLKLIEINLRDRRKAEFLFPVLKPISEI